MKNFHNILSCFVTVLDEMVRVVLIYLMSGLGDLDIPSDSDRIGVFLVHRATLFQVRFLGNPDLRE